MIQHPLHPIHARLLVITSLALIIAGCSPSGPSEQAIRDYAETARPQDPELSGIYQRSCMACHSRGTSDAPLTGDSEAWNRRLEKGMQRLVDNVVSGMGGMPPYGLCMDCDTAEFQALIEFMARPAET